MEWYVCTWYGDAEAKANRKPPRILAVKANSLPDAFARFNRVDGVSRNAVLEELVKAGEEDVRSIQQYLALHEQRHGVKTDNFWFYRIS